MTHEMPDLVSLQDLFLAMTQGGIIGRGNRVVYEASHDQVLKYEKPGDIQNASEWLLWQSAVGTPLEKYLCPCVSISPCNRWLWMMKARSATAEEKAKFKAPPWLKQYDMTQVNMGVYCSRIVLLDYGYESLDFNKFRLK